MLAWGSALAAHQLDTPLLDVSQLKLELSMPRKLACDCLGKMLHGEGLVLGECFQIKVKQKP